MVGGKQDREGPYEMSEGGTARAPHAAIAHALFGQRKGRAVRDVTHLLDWHRGWAPDGHNNSDVAIERVVHQDDVYLTVAAIAVFTTTVDNNVTDGGAVVVLQDIRRRRRRRRRRHGTTLAR